jgi:transposase-like protein
MGHRKAGVPSRRYTNEFKIEAVRLGKSVGPTEASRRLGISMSRKGDCWDNAPTESFFKTLKVERLNRLQCTSRDQARLDIVNWIEGFYNDMRLHWAIDYRSPADLERSLDPLRTCRIIDRQDQTVLNSKTYETGETVTDEEIDMLRIRLHYQTPDPTIRNVKLFLRRP